MKRELFPQPLPRSTSGLAALVATALLAALAAVALAPRTASNFCGFYV